MTAVFPPFEGGIVFSRMFHYRSGVEACARWAGFGRCRPRELSGTFIGTVRLDPTPRWRKMCERFGAHFPVSGLKRHPLLVCRAGPPFGGTAPLISYAMYLMLLKGSPSFSSVKVVCLFVCSFRYASFEYVIENFRTAQTHQVPYEPRINTCKSVLEDVVR